MNTLASREQLTWTCIKTWKVASKNTSWCLLGCSIGDFGTIAFFQFMEFNWPAIMVMVLAIINGLITSILLETAVLSRQIGLRNAFRTAIGMSLLSMIAMETAMNVTDILFTGGAILTWWVVPLMLTAGFITPLPYNYWRLKALGKACHWQADVSTRALATIEWYLTGPLTEQLYPDKILKVLTHLGYFYRLVE